MESSLKSDSVRMLRARGVTGEWSDLSADKAFVPVSMSFPVASGEWSVWAFGSDEAAVRAMAFFAGLSQNLLLRSQLAQAALVENGADV
jgi:hypothetical protein